MHNSFWGNAESRGEGGYVFKSEDPTAPDCSSLTLPTLSAQLAVCLPVWVREEASGFARATYRHTMVYTAVSADMKACEGGDTEVRWGPRTDLTPPQRLLLGDQPSLPSSWNVRG